MKNEWNIYHALKGMAMGMAEVVPGVSGGTIAFITGIYIRLIDAIKKISGIPLGRLRHTGLKATWNYIDGNFLVTLGLGMFMGIVVGVFGITYLLEHYPAMLWGFFFGLIIASAIYIGRQIAHWTMLEIIGLVLGVAIAFYITIVSPVEGSGSLPFVFISGMIAICALILPGISGSFILLLLGMYTFIIHSVKELLTDQSSYALLITIIFAGGCILGIMIFSRFLSWLLHRHLSPTLALLTGFMLGSLNRIWPWRNPTLWLEDATGEHVRILPLNVSTEDYHIIQEMNVWPANYEGTPFLIGTILCFLLGLFIVYWLGRQQSNPIEMSR
ncbi:MAG: DUF368 domain-containing protein [Saprospiraceae bacterium]|nr:DUF368 domain-containing protein [Saprospiraceae bacterium]